MSTLKKRLDTTIVNLTARIETCPEANVSDSSGPSRTTTKHTKESPGTPTRSKMKPGASGAGHSPMNTPSKHAKASIGTPSMTKMKISASDGNHSPRTTPIKHTTKGSSGTPSRTKDKVHPCEKGQDLYNRICKGLINSSRTPSKNNNKVVTPSKFFKSREHAAVDYVVIKRVSLSICDEPQDYIKDVEHIKSGKSKRKGFVTVETVMPLYNIVTGIDGEHNVKIVADIVQEMVEKSINGLSLIKKRFPLKSDIKTRNKANTVLGEGSRNDPSSLENVKEVNSVIRTSRSRKRKGSPQEIQPFMKRNKVVYNRADSSDDDDAMFISTLKPILSEDDKKEMDEVLGACNGSDKSINETEHETSSSLEIIDGKKRKEGAH